MIPPKYQNPPQAPPLFTGTKESIVADAEAMCAKTRSVLDKLAAEVTPETATFANAALPQIYEENDSSLTGHILGFYQYVSGDAELREASSKADALMQEFAIEMGMREDIFKLIDTLFARRDQENLDPESLNYLEKERIGYINNGLSLPVGPQRDRFKEIKMRLSTLGIDFSKALNEESGGIWFTPEELDGVPANVIEGLEKGTGENEGKLKLSFKYTDLFPALKFATNPDTRRRIFVGNENKVSFSIFWLIVPRRYVY